jgi:hypothetical protein
VTALAALALLAAVASASLAAPWALLLIPVLVGERVIAGRDPLLPRPHNRLMQLLLHLRATAGLLDRPTD